MRRQLTAGGVVLLMGGGFGVLLGMVTFGAAAMVDGTPLGGGAAIQVTDGYSSSYILHGNPGEVALIDCADDPNGKAILDTLRAQGLGPASVKGIFLTHGHHDHLGACKLFPGAEIYALEEEVPLIAAEALTRAPLAPLLAPSEARALRVTRPLHDGQTVTIGGLKVKAFAVPGHTAGSAAYLSNQVLYLGDSASARADRKGIWPATWAFSDNTAQNIAELRNLHARLKAQHAEVKTLAFGHTGPLNDFDALLLSGQ